MSYDLIYLLLLHLFVLSKVCLSLLIVSIALVSLPVLTSGEFPWVVVRVDVLISYDRCGNALFTPPLRQSRSVWAARVFAVT